MHDPTEGPVQLDVHCTACGAEGSHAVERVYVYEPDHLAPDLNWPAGYDGVIPSEPLVCEACGEADQFQVTTASRDAVQDRLLDALDLGVDVRYVGAVRSAAPVDDYLVTRLSIARRELGELADGGTREDRRRWLHLLHQFEQPEAREEAERLVDSDVASEAHALLAVLVEQEGEDPLPHALQALQGHVSPGIAADVFEIVEDHHPAQALKLRWSHGERTVSGVLHLLDVDPADSVALVTSIWVLEASLADEDEPAGWVERWLAGERPASRSEQRAARRKKKAQRKKGRR